jgi:hypothetical protein
MRTNRLVAVAALAAFCAVPPALAQRPALGPSELGSPPEAFARFSTDYRALVAAAMPRVSASEIARRLKRIQVQTGAESPLGVRGASDWLALFGVDSRGAQPATELVDLASASYLADPEAGRFYMTLRLPAVAPVPREEFAKTIPAIRRAHDVLADKIGIPREEIFFVDFRETLAQSTPEPQSRETETEIESAGATTTLLRAVDGLLVDGSFARFTSMDARTFEMVDVRWPRMRLVPEVERKAVLHPAQHLEAVVRRIAATEQQKAVNVIMAVVLRPVPAGHGVYFVPSLRVGVLPRSEPGRDGVRTDAGERFYLDLIEGMEGLGDRDERELAPENLDRR